MSSVNTALLLVRELSLVAATTSPSCLTCCDVFTRLLSVTHTLSQVLFTLARLVACLCVVKVRSHVKVCRS